MAPDLRIRGALGAVCPPTGDARRVGRKGICTTNAPELRHVSAPDPDGLTVGYCPAKSTACGSPEGQQGCRSTISGCRSALNYAAALLFGTPGESPPRDGKGGPSATSSCVFCSFPPTRDTYGITGHERVSEPSGGVADGLVEDRQAEEEFVLGGGQRRGDPENAAHSGQLHDVHVQAQIEAASGDQRAQLVEAAFGLAVDDQFQAGQQATSAD